MTKKIMVGAVPVGGGAPVSIQSMCSTKTDDVSATVDQILRLEEAGCEIVRVAVPDMAAARAIDSIKSRIHIPLVADIHFDYKLALEAIAAGADKVRINPGNIGRYYVKQVADACRQRGIPIRIGVNSGSLDHNVAARYGVTPEAMVESAFQHIRLLEKYDFTDICVSLKSSNVQTAMQAYQLMHCRSDYPLHIGVTEAGTVRMGTLKSAVGIGGLLALGVGVLALGIMLLNILSMLSGIKYSQKAFNGRMKMVQQLEEVMVSCKYPLTEDPTWQNKIDLAGDTVFSDSSQRGIAGIVQSLRDFVVNILGIFTFSTILFSKY